MARIRQSTLIRCPICGRSYLDREVNLSQTSAKWRPIPAACSSTCAEIRRHRELQAFSAPLRLPVPRSSLEPQRYECVAHPAQQALLDALTACPAYDDTTVRA